MRHRAHRMAPAVALAAILAVPGPVRTQVLADPALVATTYAIGFTSPSFFRFLPGTTGDLLMCEIGTGRVLHLRDGVQIGVALDLAVAYLFERGLFGMALHPDFPATPSVYLYYTASNTGADSDQFSGALENRVSRFEWDGVQLSHEEVLLHLPVGGSHNGGALAFGADGMLYGSIGEAGTTMGQLQNIGTGTPPNDTSILFRISPDGSVPEDNPFIAMGGAMAKVFAYGLRNVFGLDMDPQGGGVWCTDNGATTYDEVTRLAPGGNGGWRRIAGPVARDPEGLADLWVAPGSTYIDPSFSFFESFGITAIHFQRGTGLGAHYDGDLFVAAHNSATIYHFDVAASRASLVMPHPLLADQVADDATERDLLRWASEVGVVLDMETGPDGALYVLRFSSTSQIYRIARAATADTGVHRTARITFAPNPFLQQTRLLGLEGNAAVALYSTSGRLVQVLPAGSAWDGRDAAGRPCAAGVYHGRIGEHRLAPLVKLAPSR